MNFKSCTFIISLINFYLFCKSIFNNKRYTDIRNFFVIETLLQQCCQQYLVILYFYTFNFLNLHNTAFIVFICVYVCLCMYVYVCLQQYLVILYFYTFNFLNLHNTAFIVFICVYLCLSFLITLYFLFVFVFVFVFVFLNNPVFLARVLCLSVVSILSLYLSVYL